MNWQPIETAPKDGTYILVYPGTWNNIGASIARFDENELAKKPKPYWRRMDDFGRAYVNRERPPTHWMPLPEPPPK